MIDVRKRLSTVDRVPVPELWAETRLRAAREEAAAVDVAAPSTGWTRVATFAAALALVAAAVTLVWRAFDPTAAPRPGTGPAPAQEASDPWRDLQPTLHEFPPPPGGGRGGAAMVWTGSELVMWGGTTHDGARVFGDGFAFDASERVWEPLPPSPLSPRLAPAASWSGREILLWGGWEPGSGRDAFEGARFFGDGAAYDPSTGSWRVLPPAPINDRYPFSSVWTGSEMIVWGTGRAQPATNVSGAAYDPATNAWRRIADAPFALNEGAVVWTGEEMIVVGAYLGDLNRPSTETAIGAAYDPQRDSWRELPAFDLAALGLDAVWTGDEVVAVDARGGVAAYDPASNGWRRLPAYGPDPGEYDLEATFAAGHVLVDYFDAVTVFDPDERSWDELMIEAGGRQAIAAGTAFLFVGFNDPEDPPAPTLLWKPVTDPNWKERGGPPLEWVAVFETAPSSEPFGDDTEQLMARVGPAILVAPAGCHGGLAQTLGVSESDYFVGVRADTRAELEDAVERSGREPIFIGELEILCGV